MHYAGMCKVDRCELVVFMEQKHSAAHHVDSPPGHGEVPGEVAAVDSGVCDEVLALLDRTSTSTGRKFVRRGPGGPTQFNRRQAKQPSCANCG